MNKECEELQENLSAHLDSELVGDPLRNLQAHLSTCRNCQSIAKDYKRIKQFLREQVDQGIAGVDLRNVSEAVLGERVRSTRFGQRRWPISTLGTWAVGLAMVIALIWLGPQLLESRHSPKQSIAPTALQERLGQTIRDAAGVKFTVLQISAGYQEHLGQLIRETPRRDLQEQLGLLIRDHAHARWILDQQFGRFQEKLGLLIQTQASQQSL